jgi:uncharacterized cupin superfamily protein
MISQPGATATLASIAASGTDLLGPLEPTGPRVGADRGEPMTALRVLSDVGPVQVGVWECTPGGWSIENRPNTEIVHLLRGVARITDADGAVRTLVAGSVVVLPIGWSGRWDIDETVRKLYVTIEALGSGKG